MVDGEDNFVSADWKCVSGIIHLVYFIKILFQPFVVRCTGIMSFLEYNCKTAVHSCMIIESKNGLMYSSGILMSELISFSAHKHFILDNATNS